MPSPQSESADRGDRPWNSARPIAPHNRSSWELRWVREPWEIPYDRSLRSRRTPPPPTAKPFAENPLEEFPTMDAAIPDVPATATPGATYPCDTPASGRSSTGPHPRP